MRTIAICDDNPMVLKELKTKIMHFMTEPIQVKTFLFSKELEEYILSGAKIDILLLDIVLKDKDGISFARMIQKTFPDLKIVFITGYLEQAKRIFNVDPVYFLVKPIRTRVLEMVLKNVFLKIQEDEKKYLTLNTKNGIRKINIKDIYYIESKLRVLLINLVQEHETIYMKMDDFVALLPDTFLRVHKSFLVNMDRICHFSSEGAVMENDRKIPISRSCYKEAKKRFLEYCGNGLE